MWMPPRSETGFSPPTQSPAANSPPIGSPNTSTTCISVVTRKPPQQKLIPSTIGTAVYGGFSHRRRPGGSTTRPNTGSRSAPEARNTFHSATVRSSGPAGTPMAVASSARLPAETGGSGICPISPAFSCATTSSTTYQARRSGWARIRSTRSS
jgi:hypothetical protein